MTTAQIDKIIADAPEQLGAVLGDLRDAMLTAAVSVLTDAQESEGRKATLSVGLAIKIDLSRCPVTWHAEGSVSVRHKVSGVEVEADPDPHPTLPGMGK